MNKRTKTQFWMEFWSDFICLVLSNVICFCFFKFIYKKIVHYEVGDWIRFVLLLLLSFVLTFLSFHSNIDIHMRSKSRELMSVVKNTALTYLGLVGFTVLMKNPVMESRYLLVSGFSLTLVLSAISRYFLKRWITGYFTNSKVASIVGVVTTSDIAHNFVEGISTDWTLRVSGVALIDSIVNANDDSQSVAEANGSVATATKVKNLPSDINGVPVVATDESFLDWIRSAPLDEVFINLPYEDNEKIQNLVEELEDMGITVHINIPTLENMLSDSKFDNINCKMYSGYPMATFSATTYNTTLLAIKRALDIFFGVVGCILSTPIVLITAIPLLIESPGPLFFKQVRVGRNGRLFKIYKLRSMYTDAEKRKQELMAENKMDGLMFKMDNDPRITKVGKFIRRTSIDELPQFINVLKGDMSLIGTRPPTLDEFEQYESRHKRRLSMRPGITGMWQVSGRSDIQDFEEVVKLDCKYIDEWSPKLDIKIFFKTIYVVLTHKGAE